MKINSKEFYNVLKITSNVSKNTHIPATSYVVIKNINGLVFMLATNLESNIVVPINVDEFNPNDVFVFDPIIVMKTISSINQTIDITSSGSSLNIKTKNGKYKITNYNESDFPFTYNDDGNNFNNFISISNFANILNNVSFASLYDELRPILSGVYVKTYNNKIDVVATDANILALYSTEMQDVIDIDFVIPYKFTTILSKIINNDELLINVKDNKIEIMQNGIYLSTTKTEGKYPNYLAVFPTQDKKFIVKKDDIINAIERTGIYSNATTSYISLHIDEKNKLIMAEDIDYGNKSYDIINAEWNSENFDIGFNYKKMLNILKKVNTEDISIEMSEPNKAITINNNEYNFLLMPVMLNN